MLKDIRTLGRETLVYGLSTVVARLLNFLLTPFYTYTLTKEDLGTASAAFAYIAFFNIVYQYGMDQAYMRHAVDEDGRSPEEKFSTAFWSVLASSLALSAAVFAFAAPLAEWGRIGEHPELVRFGAGILALDALSTLPFAELRLRHKAWVFAGVRSFNIVLTLVLNVVFLRRLHLGVDGVFLANLIASGATLLLLAPLLAELVRPVFALPLWKDLVRFGLPLVASGLPSVAVQVIDRPIMLRLTDKATVGLYQANFRLGVFMALVVTMFDQAWRPFFLQKAKEPGSGALFGRILTYYLAGGFWLVLAMSFFIPDLVRFQVHGKALFHPSYWSGLVVVPLVLSAYFVYGIYINFMVAVTLSKRTGVLPWVTLLGATVNVLANFALIPYWKLMGAAWSALLAQSVMASALYLVGRRIYPVPYEGGRVLHVAGAAAAALACAYAGAVLLAGPAWFAARVAVLALFPLLLWWTHFPTEDERAAVARLLARPPLAPPSGV